MMSADFAMGLVTGLVMSLALLVAHRGRRSETARKTLFFLLAAMNWSIAVVVAFVCIVYVLVEYCGWDLQLEHRMTLPELLLSALPGGGACYCLHALRRARKGYPLRWTGLDLRDAVDALAFCVAIHICTTLANVSSESMAAGYGNESPTEWAIGAASTIVMAFVGVGLGASRTWREAAARLGLSRTRWWSLARAGGIALILALTAMAATHIWSVLQPEEAQAYLNTLEKSYLPYRSREGILFLSLLAGATEELIFRGTLQPKLGIIPTSFLFAVVHVQYAWWPAGAVVLCLGWVLGMVRQREGTIAAVFAHVIYDIVAFSTSP